MYMAGHSGSFVHQLLVSDAETQFFSLRFIEFFSQVFEILDQNSSRLLKYGNGFLKEK